MYTIKQPDITVLSPSYVVAITMTRIRYSAIMTFHLRSMDHSYPASPLKSQSTDCITHTSNYNVILVGVLARNLSPTGILVLGRPITPSNPVYLTRLR